MHVWMLWDDAVYQGTPTVSRYEKMYSHKLKGLPVPYLCHHPLTFPQRIMQQLAIWVMVNSMNMELLQYSLSFYSEIMGAWKITSI